MYVRHLDKIGLVMTFVLATHVSPIRAQQAAETEAPLTQLVSHAGAAAKVIRAKTDTGPTAFAAPLNTWTTLPNSTLSFLVGTGISEVFNVSFSAECTKAGGGQIRIRILDNGVPLHPYDGGQAFCSSSLPATHTGNWIRRTPVAPAQVLHDLVVQFLVTAGAATIDDWTFQLVVYD
jgi:hypothetical protein